MKIIDIPLETPEESLMIDLSRDRHEGAKQGWRLQIVIRGVRDHIEVHEMPQTLALNFRGTPWVEIFERFNMTVGMRANLRALTRVLMR